MARSTNPKGIAKFKEVLHRITSTEGLIRGYFPGARMEIEITSRPNIDPVTIAKWRGQVTRKVTSCTACGLHCGMAKGPVPFSGPSDNLFLAFGEGPGSEESRMGRPFVGSSGKLLRAMLNSVGINTEQVMFANVVSCFPQGDKGKPRMPSESEMRACRDNLILQVGLSESRFVLLVGGTALKAVRPDLKVTHHHGMVFLWNVTIGEGTEEQATETKYVMPIYHPAAILRQRAYKEPTIRELRLWADLVKGELDPHTVRSDSCVTCNDWLSHYDPDGVGYCTTHWPRHGNDWKLAREFWLPKVEKGHGQQTIL